VGVADEPEDPGIQDETDGPVPMSVDGGTPGTGRGPGDEGGTGDDAPVRLSPPPEPGLAATLRAVRSPLADLPGGTAFGTLVHHVLERVDTSAADLPGELRARCAEAAGYVTGLGIEPDVLADALLPALHTPCGPLLGGRTLAQVAPGDRLAELDLELPLAGGDLDARRPATLGDVAALLRTHLPPDDPFVAYADRLDALHDDPATRPGALHGYLTGSIDAVLRADVDGDTRYVVVDYKTNRLGPPDEPLTAWHYRPEAMRVAMLDAHYPLQLLLYTVGLHRFLRWRLPGYDPDRHLGGGAYLFVRGMCGPATPVVDGSPCGVVSWRPPSALVAALSALLDGRAGR